MAQATLASYRTQVQRLLHDAKGVFYSTTDLNAYINEARLRLCGDSGCFRSLQQLSLQPNVEDYPFSVLPDPTNCIDIWGVTVLWGSTRKALWKLSYTELSASLRRYVSYTTIPAAFCTYGETLFKIAPTPGQVYPAEIDTVVYPGDLTDDTTPDPIALVFQVCVKWYAAYVAKQFSQDFKEADTMRLQYLKALIGVRASRGLRTIQNPYEIGVNTAWGTGV